MAVLAEFCSVVVRKSTLVDLYPGGVEAYIHDCPNMTICSDREIFRVGFMSWADTQEFLRSLRDVGINTETGTVAVTRDDKGLLALVDWLEFDHIEGTPVVRLKGTRSVSFSAPDGWSPGGPRLMIRKKDIKKDWTFIVEQDGVSTCLNPASGEYYYIGQSKIPRRYRPWWRFW